MSDRFGPLDCSACLGGECRGGRNIHCMQRDPKPSHIAGILDSYGGVRVVVAHKRSFKKHLKCGEFLCVVTKELTHEPLYWGDIPFVVSLGEKAVASWVKDNMGTNDPDKIVAIYAYASRQTWHPEAKGSLDLTAIAFT